MVLYFSSYRKHRWLWRGQVHCFLSLSVSKCMIYFPLLLQMTGQQPTWARPGDQSIWHAPLKRGARFWRLLWCRGGNSTPGRFGLEQPGVRKYPSFFVGSFQAKHCLVVKTVFVVLALVEDKPENGIRTVIGVSVTPFMCYLQKETNKMRLTDRFCFRLSKLGELVHSCRIRYAHALLTESGARAHL